MTKRTRREELLHMFDQRASEKRCTIIKGLKDEGKELTSDIDVSVAELRELATEKRAEVQYLHDAIRKVESDIEQLYTKRAKLLSSNKLYTFNHTTCGSDELHRTLIAFDKEARKERQDLLMMKLPR